MKNKFRIHHYYAMTALIVLLAVSCTKEKDGTVKDVDGNVYKTITIGGNIWMAEDLRTTVQIKTHLGDRELDYGYSIRCVKN